MITSRFYHKNILKRAADALGDGTIYATATGATVDQDNSKFTLAGLSLIADLGADADNKFNGYILYFSSSGNIYHIVDWVAATDVATVFETPASGDTGACEIRLNVHEGDSDADYPAHRLADGKKHTLWKGSGANQTQELQIMLPNLIEDGGFEAQTAGNVGSPWAAEATKWQISATSPLLGSRMAVYTWSADSGNLVTNGDMELDSNWSDYGDPETNERSSEQAHGGTYSRKLVETEGEAGIKSDAFTTVTGKNYKVSLWYYPVNDAGIEVSVRKGNNSGWARNKHVSGTLNQWNYCTFSYTESAGGSGAFIQLYTVMAVGTWYFDDVSILEYADCYLKQNLVAKVEKGKTYRIVLKAQALTADPENDAIQIQVRQKLAPNKVIDSGMDWKPAVTTTAGWKETTFTADFSSDMLELFINALGAWDSCTGFNLDEIYVYEDIAVDRLIALGHNWNNGEISSLYGCRCSSGRTSFSLANDASANLAASVDIDGTETIVRSVTQSNYPVWRLSLSAATGITYEAGIVFLGPQMSFTKQMNRPFDPHAEEVVGIMNETPAGRRIYYSDYSRGGPYDLNFTGVNASFYADLKDWWQEVGRTKFPFFFCFDEASNPEEIKLVRCVSNFLFSYDPVLRSGGISLVEEL